MFCARARAPFPRGCFFNYFSQLFFPAVELRLSTFNFNFPLSYPLRLEVKPGQKNKREEKKAHDSSDSSELTLLESSPRAEREGEHDYWMGYQDRGIRETRKAAADASLAERRRQEYITLF